MAAKIHQFFSKLLPGLDQPKPIEVARPKAGGGLETQLDAFVAAQWAALLQQYFAQLPQALAQKAEQCQNPAEQRRCYEVLRLAHMEQARLLRGFGAELSRRLQPELALAAPAPASPPHYPQVLEEVLMLAEIEAQIASRHAAPLQEWNRRIDWIRRHMNLAVSAEALSPAGIAAALRAAFERTDAMPEQRHLLYQAFLDLVVPALGALLRECIQFLDAREVGDPSWRTPGAAAVDAAPAPATVEPDAGLHALLQTLAAAPVTPEFDDGALARLLLAELPRAESAARQRIALAARLLNQLLGDPLMPSSVKPVLDELRLPLFKVALVDASFFRDAAHPVRALLNEVAAMALAARVGPRRSLRHVMELLREVLVQFNLRAAFVRDSLRDLERLAPADEQHFLAQQNAAARARREDAQRHARRVVEQEIELHTLGRFVPTPARPFLLKGWGPLMTQRLLRSGHDSDAWQGAVARLEQVLDALDARDTVDAAHSLLAPLLDPLAAELRAEGIADAQIAPLLDGLRAAYASPKPGRAPEPPPARPLSTGEVAALLQDAPAQSGLQPNAAAQSALALVLQPGQWFRVLDHGSSQTRWLKLAAYYPRLDSVSFAGFDGSGVLRLRASQFAEDLAAQRAEPINPSPEVKSALELLAHAYGG